MSIDRPQRDTKGIPSQRDGEDEDQLSLYVGPERERERERDRVSECVREREKRA